MPLLLIIAVAILSLGGCGTLPLESDAAGDASYGPDVPLRVCVLRDLDLAENDARGMLTALKGHFAPYGLRLEYPWVRDWQRPAFRHAGIMMDVARRPLVAPCDRLLALVGRDARDFLWGALLPEVLGAVETRTHTKGYVVARTGSLNQLLSFTPPREAAVHEMFHLLGVRHGDDAHTTRRRILRIKQAALRNQDDGLDFFPAMTARGVVYTTRRAVDRRFGIPPDETCLAAADSRC